MEYLLGEPIAGRMHLDKNPAYNLTIPLVLRFFPETRLIIALRDPRDVVLSCYLRYLPLNAVSVNFLDIERTADRYALDMTAWLKYREMIQAPWCEIRYEDTVADAEKQARRRSTRLASRGTIRFSTIGSGYWTPNESRAQRTRRSRSRSIRERSAAGRTTSGCSNLP